MKKALIIGAAGFVGNYLINQLYSNNCIVTATKLPHELMQHPHAQIFDLDILHPQDITTLLNEIRPDYIFHLAAQSSVSLSWKNPSMTIDVNIKGSVNVLDSIRTLSYKPQVLLIGSGEEYGYIAPDKVPISEDTPIHPSNIYAATKACQNTIGTIYAHSYDMNIMMVRSFNHFGPGQAPMFVVSDFCKQIAQIEKGTQAPVIRVGNLNVCRDFTDVRDVVRAYQLLIEHGEKGETYNIGSGSSIKLNKLLDLILSFSSSKVSIEIDPAKCRPADAPIIEANIQKLQACTKWHKSIPLEQTILDTLNYWRSNI